MESKSSKDFEKLLVGLNNGTLDLNKVSVADYLHASFLAMFADTESVEINQEIVYKGNFYRMHACIMGVTPNQPVEGIERKV
jgi:hypothetical protein